MMLRIALFSLVCSLAFSIEIHKPFYNVEHASYYFNDFVLTYNKSYSSIAERQERLKIFTDNLIKWNKMNEKRSAVYGINRFADLTVEEFLSIYTGFKDTSMMDWGFVVCGFVRDEDIITEDAPPSWDWRIKNVVTPVKDQKWCGSGYAFSIVGNVESHYAMKNNGKQLDLSEQQLLDCTYYNNACNGGETFLSLIDIMEFGGLESEADYKYKGVQDNCHFERSSVKIKPAECIIYDVYDEDKLKEALYKNGPISIAVATTDVQGYTGGIIKECDGEVDHAALLVGYGSENGDDFWTIKNSWGKDFGEHGYFRILRGQNMCGLSNSFFISTTI